MGLKESIFQLNSFLSSLKPPEEYPYNPDHSETTQIGNGQVPRDPDDPRRGSIKITIPKELPQRYVLVLMGFLALVNIYMMYLNLFVALPAMINHNATESLRALMQGNKSGVFDDLDSQKENILKNIEKENRNFDKKLKHKDKRKEIEDDDLDTPEDVITFPKDALPSHFFDHLQTSSSIPRVSSNPTDDVLQTYYVSTLDSTVNTGEKKSKTPKKLSSENLDTSSIPLVVLSNEKLETRRSTPKNTPVSSADKEEIDPSNIDHSRTRREVSNTKNSTNQNSTTKVVTDYPPISSTNKDELASSESRSIISPVNDTLLKSVFNENQTEDADIVTELPALSPIGVTISESKVTEAELTNSHTTHDFNEASQKLGNINGISNFTSNGTLNSEMVEFVDKQETKNLVLNGEESSTEKLETESTITLLPVPVLVMTEFIPKSTVSRIEIENTTPTASESSHSEPHKMQETTYSSQFYSSTSSVLETSSVFPNHENDSIINSENFITESLPNEIQEGTTSTTPANIILHVPNSKNVLSSNVMLPDQKQTGVPLFTISPFTVINNTDTPDITETTPSGSHYNLIPVTKDSLDSSATIVGVPLPIFNENNASVKNTTQSFHVPLSIPCKNSTNCTFRNTYDVLDKVGLKSSNESRGQWVTLRPLPRSDPRERFRNGMFSNIFGIDGELLSNREHKNRGFRKYNFTDHFKLVNCSRIKALDDDDPDNEIKCYSTLGEIRLNIVDENAGSSSSSSSSSSEEGGDSEEGGVSGEVGEEKKDDGDKEDGKEGDDKKKSKTTPSSSQRNDSKRRLSLTKKPEEENRSQRNKEEGKEKEDEEDDKKEENEGKENKERKISPKFIPIGLGRHKYYITEDSSEEYDEDEDEEEDEEDEGEEGEDGEEGEEGEEDDEKNGGKYGNSPIKLDEKIPSSVCFIKKIVGEIKFEDYDEGEFVWLPSVQREVLGAYYWGFVLTQIPSGKLSSVVGGKILVLIGIVCAGLITLLSPVLASSGAYWLFAGRVFLGMAQGLCIPALQSLLAQWAPPLERTRMVAFTYSGIALGAAFGGPFSEYVLQIIGWRTLFYIQGILALLWAIFWFFLVSDSPSNHPKITNKEKQKILTSIGQQHAGKAVTVPWCSIIRSQHVLALMLAQGSFKWAWHNLLHYAPRYSLTVLHRSRPEVEFVWGAALTSMFVVTCAYGAIFDWLRKARKTSTEFVRRAANSICSLLTAAFLVGVAQSYCSVTAIKVCFAFAIAVGIPGAFSGIYANSIDLAPNHAAVITGICGTFATTANILAPFYWSLIVYERPTLERWRTIWYTSAIFLLLANCLYFLLVGTKEQRWNRPVTLNKAPKRREEDQGAISKRRLNYNAHGFKNQAYVSTEHL